MADIEGLEQLLKLLRKHGVTHYSDGTLELRLGKAVAAPPRGDEEDKAASRASEHERPARGRPANKYAHPSLWPDGSPPAFSD